MSCRAFYDYSEFISSLDPEAPDLSAAIQCLERQVALSGKKDYIKSRGLFACEDILEAVQHYQSCPGCRERFHKTKKLDSCFCEILSEVEVPGNLIHTTKQMMQSMLAVEQPAGMMFESTMQQIYQHCLEDFQELLPAQFTSEDVEGTIREIFGSSMKRKEVLPDPGEISADIHLKGVRKSWIFNNYALGVLFGYSDKKIVLHVFDLEQAGLFHWDGQLEMKDHGSLQYAVWMHAPLVFALISDLNAPQAESIYTRFYL